MSEKERNDCLREHKILELFNHPNIIRFREVYKTKSGQLCIVMDYADGGDLSMQIQNAKKDQRPFTENQILDWFTQIVIGLKHVHERKILHRDLKAQNIFLTKKHNLVKLGDFGIAKQLENTNEMAATVVGTPYYLSPEIVQSNKYDYKTDIWSLGVILYELCALKPPFNGSTIHMLAIQIVTGKYMPLPNGFSQEITDLIGRMLTIDPEQRPNVDEIL